jgi:hypothetical protein
MFNRINFQFLISYLGVVPFLIILFDKFFLFQLESNITKDFIIFYSLIIFVFIGALHWDFKNKLSPKLIFLGFIPSLLTILILLLFLCSYEVFFLIINCYLIQLIADKFIYKEKTERMAYYKIRVPLTLLIVLSLLLIQL